MEGRPPSRAAGGRPAAAGRTVPGESARAAHRHRIASRRSPYALPSLLIAVLVVAGAGSTAAATLALVALAPGWSVLLFYTLPGLLFVGWSVRYLAPSRWRRAVFPFAVRRRRLAERIVPPPSPARAAAAAAARARADEEAWRWEVARRERPRGLLGSRRLARLEERAIRPWLLTMRAVMSAWRTPRVRRALNVVFGIAALALTALAAAHFAEEGLPLAGTDATRVAAAGALLLMTFGFKAAAWQLLFRRHERPPSLSLATATGVAAVGGIVLPGRFDDALRISVVRRLAPSAAGVGTIALSLFVLGLIDTAAMIPFAALAAADSGAAGPLRVAFAVVAAAGVGAALMAAGLPRIAAAGRLGRYRLARWLSRHSPGSGRDTLAAGVLVFATWLSRAAGLVVLLSAFGFGVSFPLAAAYLAGAAASAALPVAPAGAATQAGVGAAVLVGAGLSADDAIAFSVAAQMLTIIAGAVVAAFAVGLQTASRGRA